MHLQASEGLAKIIFQLLVSVFIHVFFWKPRRSFIVVNRAKTSSHVPGANVCSEPSFHPRNGEIGTLLRSYHRVLVRLSDYICLLEGKDPEEDSENLENISVVLAELMSSAAREGRKAGLLSRLSIYCRKKVDDLLELRKNAKIGREN